MSIHSWKISKLQQKKSSAQLVTTFSFPGSSPNIKRTVFSWMSPGRLLLKLIYWNKSVQRINIITTNEYKEQPPTIIEKFPSRQLWGESVISKNTDMNISLRVFGYCHNLQLLFGNFSRKFSVDKTLLQNCFSTSIFTY